MSRANIKYLLSGTFIALSVMLLITLRVFSGSFSAMTAQADYPTIIFINSLVGISVALFVLELRWVALRVTLTVVVALIFGYLMTAIFNLDEANRFRRGEFLVKIISEAQPPENDDVDLQYGRQRGGAFNDLDAAEPLKEAIYTFAGQAGDSVSLLGFAENRRSLVDMQITLLDADGEVLAEGFNATEAQLQSFDELRSTTDAIIENFRLPLGGVYTVRAQPESIAGSVVFREMFASTNQAYEAFLLGPLSRVNRWAFWIQDSLTLIMLGLAIAVVFRAEQFSLGAEGQIFLGALAAGAVGLTLTNLPAIVVIPLAVISAAIAGFLWGLLPGVLKAYVGANELVSTLMLNTVAIKFYDLVLSFQLKPPDAGGLYSEWLPDTAVLATIIDGSQVTIAIFILIAMILTTWLLMRRTPLGYEIRMIGANIQFADYGGINTKRTIMLSMAISGLIAGIAGAHLTLGIHRRLVSGISRELGFEGIVVALLARNNVLVIPFAGLLYAYLRVGGQFMERDANISFEVVRIIQAVIILLITAEGLVSFARKRRIRREASSAMDAGGSEPLPDSRSAQEAARV